MYFLSNSNFVVLQCHMHQGPSLNDLQSWVKKPGICHQRLEMVLIQWRCPLTEPLLLTSVFIENDHCTRSRRKDDPRLNACTAKSCARQNKSASSASAAKMKVCYITPLHSEDINPLNVGCPILKPLAYGIVTSFLSPCNRPEAHQIFGF